MTASEQKTVQKISETQGEMKAHQKYMQGDIDELKQIVKEMSVKLDNVTKTLDNLSGGKQALMWITGVALTVAGLSIAFINLFKEK